MQSSLYDVYDDDTSRGETHARTHARTLDMAAGKKNAPRGGKRAAKSDDDDEEVEEDEEERVVVEDHQRQPDADDADANGNVDGNGAEEEEERGGEGDGIEDRDDGGATAGRIPRDAAVVRDILKSMVRMVRIAGVERGDATF